MAAIDPFTAASPTYRDAIRHPFTSGAGFEIMRGRSLEWRSYAKALAYALPWIAGALLAAFLFGQPLVRGFVDRTAYPSSSQAMEQGRG